MADPSEVVAPDEEVAGLLAERPEDFVATRKERVRALKAAGRKDEAAALAKVRKPTRQVWALGEIARRHPHEATEALGAAEALAGGPGEGGTRDKMRRLRDAVEALASRAPEVDEALDPASTGLALRTVLADDGARGAWGAGVLLALPEEEAPAAGGGAARRSRAVEDAPAARRLRAAPDPPPDEDDDEDGAAAERARRAEHERALAAARDELEEAERRVSDADADLAAREEEVDAARAEVEDAERALDAAERRLREVRDARRTAHRERDRAQRRVDRAEEGAAET